ncbi:MAG: aminomethyl-transferring glycine dehydrogenase, partial [Oligoflexia bacterium]|nr:aminomethyl-transferring glycine dehydrogenase [Oligoflexia bacterium]
MREVGAEQGRRFEERHIGPSAAEVAAMLKALGCSSLAELDNRVIPAAIRQGAGLQLSDFPQALSETEAIKRLQQIMSQNELRRSFIGAGYYNCITPPVIQRNILENPGWYTQYTPYQPEISQGRLEALLNYQTMVTELTGLAVSNASLLDEATAAAEAMSLCLASVKDGERDTIVVAEDCHPQTIAVVQTRADALGLKVRIAAPGQLSLDSKVFAALLQYPGTYGDVRDYSGVIASVHAAGALAIVATDLLALLLLKSPGEIGADVAVGSAQRFGVPLGYGGPHAAFLAVKDEYKRAMPGRLVGVSKDADGHPALRLSLQTREQHIRREKATSNICTAQVLLAIMASMYAVYHGPKGLYSIAAAVQSKADRLAAALKSTGLELVNSTTFDTVTVRIGAGKGSDVEKREAECALNLRHISETLLAVSVDECSTESDLVDLVYVLSGRRVTDLTAPVKCSLPEPLRRSSAYLTHPVFNSYHSETEFLRYLKRLEARDLSLAISMIPLGSCTMKLNATSEMLPVTWEQVGGLHPFAPAAQARGYSAMFGELERALAQITGFDGVSLQPNAGSQGEYAGLLVVRGYLDSIGQRSRDICLIPKSAHGTNPASAVMAGFKVVVVECDAAGNVDLADLKARAAEHAKDLALVMVTYPSTHGVFEEQIKELTQIVHAAGGQVYMDGANLNAQVGLTSPALIGADLCHINLHKTFCIPHGGGGPGMGPIAVKAHLVPFLPNHPLVSLGHEQGIGAVAAAPWGSASILTIPWMYIAMMGGAGLTRATEIAILNANYIARKLEPYYPVLYKGKHGFVAHECILDLREIKKNSGVEVDDVAKRLMDYGFHAPTVSFPVPGTIMIEPTESESKAELDRFCEAMIAIRGEIAAIEEKKIELTQSPLRNAPHTALKIASDQWNRPYSRELGAFPAPWTREFKFWPAVARIDA